MSHEKQKQKSIPLHDESLTKTTFLQLLESMERRAREEQAGSLRLKIQQMRTRGGQS